jgi:N6-adenosine-specific RNA methylase IME4
MIPFPAKTYDIILADPPWSYDKLVGKGSIAGKYQGIPTKVLCSIPVGSLARKDSVLFIWGTFPMLKDCMQVIDAWGFTFKTAAFVWVKTYKNAGTYCRGVGNYTLSNAEVCFVAIKGKGLERARLDISQIVVAPRREHSRKPSEVGKAIIDLYGERDRIELFAREQVKGWTSWGRQVNYFG